MAHVRAVLKVLLKGRAIGNTFPQRGSCFKREPTIWPILGTGIFASYHVQISRRNHVQFLQDICSASYRGGVGRIGIIA